MVKRTKKKTARNPRPFPKLYLCIGDGGVDKSGIPLPPTPFLRSRVFTTTQIDYAKPSGLNLVVIHTFHTDAITPIGRKIERINEVAIYGKYKRSKLFVPLYSTTFDSKPFRVSAFSKNKKSRDFLTLKFHVNLLKVIAP